MITPIPLNEWAFILGEAKMIMTLNVYSFRDAFNQVRPQQFTYEALGELFEYYEELDEGTEFDPVAICCEWSEVERGCEEHTEAVDAEAFVIELDNGNVLIQEY